MPPDLQEKIRTIDRHKTTKIDETDGKMQLIGGKTTRIVENRRWVSAVDECPAVV